MKSTPEQITARYIEAYYTLYSRRIVASRKQFCELTELVPQNFSAIEQGKRSANLNQICALINNLKVSPEWIMTGEGKIL